MQSLNVLSQLINISYLKFYLHNGSCIDIDENQLRIMNFYEISINREEIISCFKKNKVIDILIYKKNFNYDYIDTLCLVSEKKMKFDIEFSNRKFLISKSIYGFNTTEYVNKNFNDKLIGELLEFSLINKIDVLTKYYEGLISIFHQKDEDINIYPIIDVGYNDLEKKCIKLFLESGGATEILAHSGIIINARIENQLFEMNKRLENEITHCFINSFNKMN